MSYLLFSTVVFSDYVAVVFHQVFIVVHQQQSFTKYTILLLYFIYPAVGPIGLSLSQRPYEPLPGLVIALFVALAVVVHGERVSELQLEQAFVADVAFCCTVILVPVFWHHHKRLFVGHLCAHQLFVFQ